MEDKNNNNNNIAVKKLSALLRGITSKNNSNFYDLNCLCSFRKKKNKNKLATPKKVCENKDFCGIVMPYEDTNILEFNQYQKSDKTTSIIFTDLEPLIKK